MQRNGQRDSEAAASPDTRNARADGPIETKTCSTRPGRIGRGRDHQGADAAVAREPRKLAERVEAVGQRRVELDDIAQEPEVTGQRSRQAALEHGQREIERQRGDDPEADGAAEGGNRGWARGRQVH